MRLPSWSLIVAALAVGFAAPPVSAAVPTTIRVSVTNAGAQAGAPSGFENIAMSASGRYVVFESVARLAPVDTNNGEDVYVRDLVGHTTALVSVRRNGGPLGDGFAPVAISTGGRWLAYESCALQAGNCGTIVYNQITGQVLPRPFGTAVANLAISDRGRYVAEDNGAFFNAFVVRTNVRTGVHRQVDVDVPGAEIDDFSLLSGMSAEGRFILFTHYSGGRGPSRVFIRDMALHRTRLVSMSSTGESANASAVGSAISADGRTRMFTSPADNLVAGDTNGVADVFIRIRGSTRTRRVSVGTDARQGNHPSGGLALSRNGRFCLFWSKADNLVPGDTNHSRDLFVRDLVAHRTFRVDLRADGSQIASLGIPTGTMSADGRWVAWVSRAGGIVPGDTNGVADVFARGPLR